MSASFRLSVRALSIALSTAIGLAPMASFAQQAQPRPANPRPAQPAQPAQPPAGAGPTVVITDCGILEPEPGSEELRLVARYDHDVTEAEWALGFRFDVVVRGPRATPFEEPAGG